MTFFSIPHISEYLLKLYKYSLAVSQLGELG